MKTYNLELVLVECSEEGARKVLRTEEMCSFPTEMEAREAFESIELPDPKHTTVI